jgi:hypothetical protein
MEYTPDGAARLHPVCAGRGPARRAKSRHPLGIAARRAPLPRVREAARHGTCSIKGCQNLRPRKENSVEVTKALSALQPLYRKDNVEIVTEDGTRVRGVVRSMKTTQALTTPSVKIERPDGEIVKIPFNTIAEIIDHNAQ